MFLNVYHLLFIINKQSVKDKSQGLSPFWVQGKLYDTMIYGIIQFGSKTGLALVV